MQRMENVIAGSEWYVDLVTYQLGRLSVHLRCNNYQQMDVNYILEIFGRIGVTTAWYRNNSRQAFSSYVSGELSVTLPSELQESMEAVVKTMSHELLTHTLASTINKELYYMKNSNLL